MSCTLVIKNKKRNKNGFFKKMFSVDYFVENFVNEPIIDLEKKYSGIKIILVTITPKEKRVKKKIKLKKRIKIKPIQTGCCILGCKNYCSNRLKFSLRLESKFKKKYKKRKFHRICDQCYFKDLYRYKKRHPRLKRKKKMDELNFEVFKPSNAISIPEVFYGINTNEIQKDISNYVKNFKNFSTKQDFLKVKKKLLKYNLNNFEISCLLNLLPGTVEEALALIPCLKKSLKEDELKEIIDFL